MFFFFGLIYSHFVFSVSFPPNFKPFSKVKKIFGSWEEIVVWRKCKLIIFFLHKFVNKEWPVVRFAESNRFVHPHLFGVISLVCRDLWLFKPATGCFRVKTMELFLAVVSRWLCLWISNYLFCRLTKKLFWPFKTLIRKDCGFSAVHFLKLFFFRVYWLNNVYSLYKDLLFIFELIE